MILQIRIVLFIIKIILNMIYCRWILTGFSFEFNPFFLLFKDCIFQWAGIFIMVFFLLRSFKPKSLVNDHFFVSLFHSSSKSIGGLLKLGFTNSHWVPDWCLYFFALALITFLSLILVSSCYSLKLFLAASLFFQSI